MKRDIYNVKADTRIKSHYAIPESKLTIMLMKYLSTALQFFIY